MHCETTAIRNAFSLPTIIFALACAVSCGSPNHLRDQEALTFRAFARSTSACPRASTMPPWLWRQRKNRPMSFSAQVNDEVVGIQSPNRMKMVTGVKWDGTRCKVGRPGKLHRHLQVDLYLVSSSGKNRTYTFFRSFSMPGRYTAANLANAVAAEKQYAFRHRHCRHSTIDRELGLTDSIPLRMQRGVSSSAGTENPPKKKNGWTFPPPSSGLPAPT